MYRGSHCDSSEKPCIVHGSCSPPSSLPSSPSCLLKTIAKYFVVLFCISTLSPSAIFPGLHLLHSPSPLPHVPPPHIPILQSCLPFESHLSQRSQGFLDVSAVDILNLGWFNPFYYSATPIIQQLSVCVTKMDRVGAVSTLHVMKGASFIDANATHRGWSL